MLKNPVQNPLPDFAAGLMSARPSLLFIDSFWPQFPVDFENIRPSAAPSESSCLRSPCVEDATDHIEALRERGSFPRRLDSWWSFQDIGVSGLVYDYRVRSAPFMFKEGRGDLGDQYLFTNEPDYPSAIERIEGIGGVYVGVGHMLSFVYPAWQGAAHAYAMDLNSRVPATIVPALGAMLAMSADRIEFLSLISGKPIPKNDQWRGLIDAHPGVIYEFINAVPRSYSFESVLETAFRMVMGDTASYEDAMSYISRVRRSVASDRPSAHSNVHPLSILSAKDSRGRGGPLAGEESFKKARDLFIDGRITGVASPIEGRGMSAIAERISADNLGGAVLYISNAEDWLFEDLIKALNGDQRLDARKVESAIHTFFKSMASSPMTDGAVAIFTHNCYPTVAKRLDRYVQNAMPLAEDAAKAARSALALYPLRSEEGLVAREPPMRRAKLLAERLKGSEAMHEIASVLRQGWRGRPLNRTDAETALRERSSYFREALIDWERGAVLRVLEDMGIIVGGGA